MKRVLLVLLTTVACAGCNRKPAEPQGATPSLASAPGSLETSTPGWHAVAFESERWKHADEFGRFDMLQDLVDNHLCRGMSGAELEGLLGPLTAGWSDAATGHSYVFWVERPREQEAYLEYWRETVVPRELRNVVGLRLDLERDRLARWELIKH